MPLGNQYGIEFARAFTAAQAIRNQREHTRLQAETAKLRHQLLERQLELGERELRWNVEQGRQKQAAEASQAALRQRMLGMLPGLMSGPTTTTQTAAAGVARGTPEMAAFGPGALPPSTTTQQPPSEAQLRQLAITLGLLGLPGAAITAATRRPRLTVDQLLQQGQALAEARAATTGGAGRGQAQQPGRGLRSGVLKNFPLTLKMNEDGGMSVAVGEETVELDLTTVQTPAMIGGHQGTKTEVIGRDPRTGQEMYRETFKPEMPAQYNRLNRRLDLFGVPRDTPAGMRAMLRNRLEEIERAPQGEQGRLLDDFRSQIQPLLRQTTRPGQLRFMTQTEAAEAGRRARPVTTAEATALEVSMGTRVGEVEDRGITPLTAAARTRRDQLRDQRGKLEDIASLIERIGLPESGSVSASAELGWIFLKQPGPEDPRFDRGQAMQEYLAGFARWLTEFARSAGEKGQITDRDINRIAETMPIVHPKQSALAKGLLVDSIHTARTKIRRIMKDVEGILKRTPGSAGRRGREGAEAAEAAASRALERHLGGGLQSPSAGGDPRSLDQRKLDELLGE
jgi:hypothetical protein